MCSSIATATSFTAQVLLGDADPEKLSGMLLFLESLEKDRTVQRAVGMAKRFYPSVFDIQGESCPCRALKANIEHVLEYGNPSDEMIDCLLTIAHALIVTKVQSP